MHPSFSIHYLHKLILSPCPSLYFFFVEECVLFSLSRSIQLSSASYYLVVYLLFLLLLVSYIYLAYSPNENQFKALSPYKSQHSLCSSSKTSKKSNERYYVPFLSIQRPVQIRVSAYFASAASKA